MKSSILILLILVSSCASKRIFPREEWLKVGQKEFTQVKKEDLIKAAEKVFILADGDDFKFVHKPSGFEGSTVSGVWNAFLAQWTFDVFEKNNQILATAKLANVGHNDSGEGTAVYQVFWARLDYLLGRSNHWPDCKTELEKMGNSETEGTLVGICDSARLSDEYPDNLSDSEIERIFKENYEGKIKYLKKHRLEEYKKYPKKL